jgi:putative ATP-dependent endonuclease of OLD family
MHVVHLMISAFRGVRSANVAVGRHAVLVGPNNSGKTRIVEALALLFGRDRLACEWPALCKFRELHDL